MWMDKGMNRVNGVNRIGTYAQAVVTAYLLTPGIQQQYGSYL